MTLAVIVAAGELIGLSLGALGGGGSILTVPVLVYEHNQPPRRTIMCRPVTCKQCGKTTWAGCGQHVAQVKASVPARQWCAGHPREENAAGGWLARLLKR